MKKTLIAAAIATVAAAPAMADVAISGQVKVTIADSDTSDYAPSYDNSLTFKASEDLGNGMTAFAQITRDTDTNDRKDEKLGLKGDFGTLVAGRMEFLTEGVVSAMMDDGGGHTSSSTNLETNLTAIGRADAIAYVSPTFNGFHVAAAGNMDGTDNGMFKSTDLLVAYDNGPFAVKVANTQVEAGSADYSLTSVGGSYTMGDLKVSALSVEKDYDAASSTDETDTMVRLDYKMGNNSLLLGAINDDTADSDVTVVKLTHKMSSRTAVWIGARDKDTGVTGGDVTHFGMIHKF